MPSSILVDFLSLSTVGLVFSWETQCGSSIVTLSPCEHTCLLPHPHLGTPFLTGIEPPMDDMKFDQPRLSLPKYTPLLGEADYRIPTI